MDIGRLNVVFWIPTFVIGAWGLIALSISF
jgi:hypothetical protein